MTGRTLTLERARRYQWIIDKFNLYDLHHKNWDRIIIINQLLLSGLTYGEIGSGLAISVERVRQIHAYGMAVIRKQKQVIRNPRYSDFLWEVY